MAQTGYTPISIYYSATATNTPTAGNLVAGELAINTADGKLFYKDSSGVVQTIASKAGNVNVSSFSGGSTGLTPNTATTGVVTLAGTLASANGGTGQTNITFPSSGGTAMVSGNMPAFRAYASTGTVISANTTVKIIFDTFSYDTNSNYSTSNYRFTPTVAGYYQISIGVRPAAVTGENAVYIYKNGSNYATLYDATITALYSTSSSNLVQMNGSTDYIEIYMYSQLGGTTPTGSATMYFSGVLVRNA